MHRIILEKVVMQCQKNIKTDIPDRSNLSVSLLEDAVCELRQQLADKTEELDDWREGHRRVMSEDCPSDEKHCACVPTLRRELAKVKPVVETAKILLPLWPDWCDKDGKHEKNGHYLWNTRGFYNFADEVRELIAIQQLDSKETADNE